MTKPNQQAVALRYESGNDRAPFVVAKGSGYVAEKIIEAARQHEIPLLSDPIAGDLLRDVEIGMEIPAEFYQVVAEILAFIYHLDGQPQRF